MNEIKNNINTESSTQTKATAIAKLSQGFLVGELTELDGIYTIQINKGTKRSLTETFRDTALRAMDRFVNRCKEF